MLEATALTCGNEDLLIKHYENEDQEENNATESDDEHIITDVESD